MHFIQFNIRVGVLPQSSTLDFRVTSDQVVPIFNKRSDLRETSASHYSFKTRSILHSNPKGIMNFSRMSHKF